jgi:hypothetical protein
MQDLHSSSEMRQAFQMLEQGNLVQAKLLFEKLLHIGEKQAEKGLQKARDELSKRYWRQGKVEEMEKIAPTRAHLAIARLQGDAALQKIATSENPEAFLALLSLEESPKTALISLRKMPEYKSLAEGWISLLKQDFIKARDSFQEALALQPKRAKLGLAIVDAAEGNLAEGQKKISKFLRIALHRFPHLAKLMGKTKEGAESAAISQLFYRGNAENLEKVLSQLRSDQKTERGWIFARLGDLEYAKKSAGSLDKAYQYWDKAAKLYPQLKLDMLKRKFLTAKYLKDKQEAFLDYFHALHHQSKEKIPSFLQNILLFHSLDFLEKIPIPFFSTAQQKWTIANPPKELSLLALAIIVGEHNSLLLANPPPAFLAESVSIPTLFLEDLPALDAIFKDQRFYLELKVKIYSLTNNQIEKRKILMRLMELDPMQMHLLLPKFMQCALLTVKADTINLSQEVERLSFLYPSHFDLARLLYLCHAEERAKSYEQSLSSSLQTALHLQVSIDRKEDKKTEELFTTMCALYGQDEEINWRFWHAMSNCSSVKFKKIASAFDKFLSTFEERKKVFDSISRYQETHFEEAFLEYWIDVTDDWTPYMSIFLESLEGLDEDCLPVPPEKIFPDETSKQRILTILPFVKDDLLSS